MSDTSEKIFQALGEASMCWSETPKGVFDSNKAKEIGEKLMKDLGLDLPEDQEYEPTGDEDETVYEVDANFINSEAKLILIGFEHSNQSTTNFTEYQKIINGVTWAYVTRMAGSDYLTKDGDLVCYCETWALLNNALDEYDLRD